MLMDTIDTAAVSGFEGSHIFPHESSPTDDPVCPRLPAAFLEFCHKHAQDNGTRSIQLFLLMMAFSGVTITLP